VTRAKMFLRLVKQSLFGPDHKSLTANQKSVLFTIVLLAAPVMAPTSVPTPALPSVLAEIDRRVRDEFWDPKLKGVDWNGAVAAAAREIGAARDDAARDAA